MDVKRTPDARFDRLDGYPFPPHYAEVKAEDGTALRVHYVDEGPRGAAPVVLMHGNPSWSYLYRKMIPRLVGARAPLLAPDLVGLGRSDKPRREERLHAPAPRGLDGPVLVAVGVETHAVRAGLGRRDRLPGRESHPERFARAGRREHVPADGRRRARAEPPALQQWLDYSDRATALPIAQLIKSWVVRRAPPRPSSAPTTRPSRIRALQGRRALVPRA